jgi:predicted nucleotidyltransferase
VKGTEQRQQQIHEIVQRIRDRYQPERIILYGSYAWGKPDRASDVDLLILKRTEARPIDREVEVSRLLDLRDPAYPPVENWVLTPGEFADALKQRHPFVRQIVERGEVLYGTG